jgi:hypothetical protein
VWAAVDQKRAVVWWLKVSWVFSAASSFSPWEWRPPCF